MKKKAYEIEQKTMFYAVIMYLSSVYTIFIQNCRLLGMLSFWAECR